MPTAPSVPRAVRLPRALGPKSHVFGRFGLGLASRGSAAIPVSRSHGVTLTIVPHRSTLSFSLARSIHTHTHTLAHTHTLSLPLHRPPSPHAANRQRRSTLKARPRVPAPRAVFVLKTPGSSHRPIFLYPFQNVKTTAHPLSDVPSHPQDAVRGRADHRARRQTRRRTLLSAFVPEDRPYRGHSKVVVGVSPLLAASDGIVSYLFARSRSRFALVSSLSVLPSHNPEIWDDGFIQHSDERARDRGFTGQIASEESCTWFYAAMFEELAASSAPVPSTSEARHPQSQPEGGEDPRSHLPPLFANVPFLAFPSMPHSRAALATRSRRVIDPGSHPCEVLRRAEAPLFPFPTSRHSCAALALRQRRARDRSGPAYNTLRPAEAGATPCDATTSTLCSDSTTSAWHHDATTPTWRHNATTSTQRCDAMTLTRHHDAMRRSAAMPRH
ncbi:hypothetical protein EDB84DRAFT_1679930 [Lactarius hengduanensis]|nr:hypothetical protein EDB84DRAFT_1679930 [Lactarius hengduanensis]